MQNLKRVLQGLPAYPYVFTTINTHQSGAMVRNGLDEYFIATLFFRVLFKIPALNVFTGRGNGIQKDEY